MHSTVVAWYVMSYVTFQSFLTTHKFVLIHLYWYYHCYYYKLSNTESSVALGEKMHFYYHFINIWNAPDWISLALSSKYASYLLKWIQAAV